MQIIAKRLVDSILIMPNTEHVFGPDAAAAPLAIVAQLTFGDIATIYLTKLGAIAIQFLDSGELASIEQLDAVGPGAFAIPDYVTERRDEILVLQGRRLLFANFIAGAVFGRICAIRHTALSGAVSAGMNDILAFERRGDAIAVENTAYATEVLGPKLAAAKQNAPHMQLISAGDLSDAARFTESLAARASAFAFANLQVCMAMNYQAAVLHHAQLAPASFAINFSVAEALINEVFFAYGAVTTVPRQAFAAHHHTMAPVSRKTLRERNLKTKIEDLEGGGLISSYLGQRLQAARLARNDLMHGAIPVAVTASGDLQTIVRDLWGLLLDAPFELNAGFAMRV